MGLAKYLVIGSFEAYSGKSAITLGLAHQLRQQGIDLAYCKPIGGDLRDAKSDAPDADVAFISEILQLDASRIQPTLFNLDNTALDRYLANPDQADYPAQLARDAQNQAGDLVILQPRGDEPGPVVWFVAAPNRRSSGWGRVAGSEIPLNHVRPAFGRQAAIGGSLIRHCDQ